MITELKRSRRQAIGINNEEFVIGMVAISVPVYDNSHQVIAAIACHAPTARWSLRQLLDFIPVMRKASHEMAEVLVICPPVSDDAAHLEH